MNENIPKIIDEMQKIKDIATNFLIIGKLSEEYNRTMHQLDAINSTAAAIQKEIVKNIVMEFLQELNRDISRKIKMKFNICSDLMCAKDISTEKISLSFLGKNFLLIENKNTTELLNEFFDKKQSVEFNLSLYLSEISDKIIEYCDYVDANKKCAIDAAFSIAFNTNKYNKKMISIKKVYNENVISELYVEMADFMELSVEELCKTTDVKIETAKKLQEHEELKKSYIQLQNTISSLKKIKVTTIEEMDAINEVLKDILNKQEEGEKL